MITAIPMVILTAMGMITTIIHILRRTIRSAPRACIKRTDPHQCTIAFGRVPMDRMMNDDPS